MYKFFLSLVLVGSLSAEIVDGVAVVVKGSAITLYDIKKEMRLGNLDVKKATDSLIRKKLEELEVDEKNIHVGSGEVYDDIKKVASANKMSVSEFYEAVRESNGLSSADLKKKIKEKLLNQKLYASIAYSSVSQPTDLEVEEYFELHKESFIHPSAFTTLIYKSKDRARLQEKIDNPMFYSPDIVTNEQELPYNKIAPELALLLEKTSLNSFSTIVPDGQGAFMSFYIKEIHESATTTLDSAKNQIINKIMAEQRENVLGDYFAKLQHNADIEYIRMPE